MEKEDCIYYHHDGCLYHYDFRSCENCKQYNNKIPKCVKGELDIKK